MKVTADTTDLDELRRLCERMNKTPQPTHEWFCAISPVTVLALLERVERAEAAEQAARDEAGALRDFAADIRAGAHRGGVK